MPRLSNPGQPLGGGGGSATVDFALFSPGRMYSLQTDEELQIANAAAANTLGAWTSFGTVSRAYQEIQINAVNIFTQDAIIDIGIDPAGGTSFVFAAAVYMNRQAGNYPSQSHRIPLSVPNGASIGVRHQMSGAAPHFLYVSLFGIAYTTAPTLPTVGTIALDRTNTRPGPAVDPGATINTFGAWTQLTASSAAAFDAVCPLIGTNTVTFQDYAYVFEIGTGAAASEVTVASFGHRTGTGASSSHPHWIPLTAQIAAGTRISVRAKCSGNNASFRNRDVGLIYATKP